MNKIIVFLVVLAFLALAGCQPAAVAEPTQMIEAEETEETLLPTVTPLVALPAQTDYCLDCHSDKDMLVALATEKEDAHGDESEGVG